GSATAFVLAAGLPLGSAGFGSAACATSVRSGRTVRHAAVVVACATCACGAAVAGSAAAACAIGTCRARGGTGGCGRRAAAPGQGCASDGRCWTRHVRVVPATGGEQDESGNCSQDKS